MKLTGYLTIDEFDAEFTFYFDETEILLTQKKKLDAKVHDNQYSFRPFKPLVYESLHARTTMGGDVYFLNVRLFQRDLIGNELIGVCNFYILPSTQNSFFNDFKSLIFQGKIVDKFYPPSLCLVNQYGYTAFTSETDGSKSIRIKKADDFTINKEIQIDGVTVNFVLTVRVTGKLEDSNSVGNMNSVLKLTFDSNQLVGTVITWYNMMLRTFQFMFNRQNIDFDEITIFSLNEKNTVTKQGSFHVARKSELSEYTKSTRDSFKYSYVIDHLDLLLPIMYDNNINMYHLPKDDTDDKFLDPKKLVFTASSFEYEFSKLKDTEIRDLNEINMVKGKIIDFIDNLDIEFRGNKKQRKILSSVKNIVNYYEKSLEVRIAEQLQRFEHLLMDLIEKTNKTYNTEGDYIEIGRSYAKARNKNAHGALESYENCELAAYVIVRALVYIMILKRCGVEDTYVKQIIEMHYII
ncbi:MAG: hypothetical protein AB7E09_06460 [Candidatus Izemoplasmatales bacterium]